jgi:hypothetical protein
VGAVQEVAHGPWGMFQVVEDPYPVAVLANLVVVQVVLAWADPPSGVEDPIVLRPSRSRNSATPRLIGCEKTRWILTSTRSACFFLNLHNLRSCALASARSMPMPPIL